MAEVYNKGKLDILQQEFKQWGNDTNSDYPYVGQISSGFTKNGFLFEDGPNADCRNSDININYIVIGH